MTRILFSGEHLNVERRSRDVRGVEQSFEVVTRPHIVVCVPRMPDGRLLLVRQYRAGCGGVTLEFPAGRVEQDERADHAIRRELIEEAGYISRCLYEVGGIITAPHFADERGTIFVADGEIEGLPKPTPREDFQTPQFVSIANLEDLIAEGRLSDAKSICAFALFQIWLKRS